MKYVHAITFFTKLENFYAKTIALKKVGSRDIQLYKCYTCHNIFMFFKFQKWENFLNYPVTGFKMIKDYDERRLYSQVNIKILRKLKRFG